MKRKKLMITAGILIVVIVSVICLEYYAHTYIHVDNLSVVSSEDAFRVPNITADLINDSCTFSSNGATWLLLFQTQKYPSNPSAIVRLLIFKIQQNTNYFVQSLDLVGSDLKIIVNNEDGTFWVTHYGFGPENNNNNCSSIMAPYIVYAGTWNTNFDFSFKVYESTLLGVLLVNETIIQFNETITVPIWP